MQVKKHRRSVASVIAVCAAGLWSGVAIVGQDDPLVKTEPLAQVMRRTQQENSFGICDDRLRTSGVALKRNRRPIRVLFAQSGYTYAVSGRWPEADRAVRELLAISETRYVPPCNVALVYHGLGTTTEALRWLEQACEERDVHMVFLAVDPKSHALRGDERFVSILKRMKLPSGRPSDVVSSRTSRLQGAAR